MPLLDHFRPPLSERRPWDSFHATWCGSLADHLNDGVLPSGFIALVQINPGAPIEIDVATFSEARGTPEGGIATLPRTVWTPVTAPLVAAMTFPDRRAVEIYATDGGRTLVAAIELVSPGNKDRPAKRHLFASKCAAFLARVVGLIIIDVVTSRHGNLHNQLVTHLGFEAAMRLEDEVELYAVAYRPLNAETGRVEMWPFPLQLGAELPALPLSLAAEVCVKLELETSYADACRRRRIDEAR